jgi:hypothetical protein
MAVASVLSVGDDERKKDGRPEGRDNPQLPGNHVLNVPLISRLYAAVFKFGQAY